MRERLVLNRRAMGGALASLTASALLSLPSRAAAAGGTGSVADMVSALQSAAALTFDVEASFGASAGSSGLRTLGPRAHVVFERPDRLFAVFGGGGGEDVQLLIDGGEATLFRLPLASKTVLKLMPENGAAFAVPGLFLPFLGLLGGDVNQDFFGSIQSTTPIAQGAPDQPEQTTLTAVMGKRFTGEVWVDKSNGLPGRIIGTWFGAKADVAASAALNLTGWTTQVPAVSRFAVEGLADAKQVGIDELGL